MNTTSTDPTRQRLIEAAEPIFADRGYEGASVRAICDAARANIAAVNYHFGDKRSLYLETVRYAVHSCCILMHSPTPPTEMSALQRLQAFLRGMVHGMLEVPRPSAMRLMMREMTDPTEACTVAVDEFIRPMADQLRALLRPLLPDDLPDLRLWMIGQSIVAQSLYYRQNRAIVQRLMGDELFAQLSVGQVSDHIIAFTMAALGFGPPVPTKEQV